LRRKRCGTKRSVSNPMVRMVSQRVAFGILTLMLVSVLIFAGTEILPGDVATAILGNQATPETLDAIRRSLHLYDPASVRYWRWFIALAHGDLGTSLTNGMPVWELLGFRLRNTLFLAGLTASMAVPLALILGIIATIRQNRAADRIITIATLTFISFPEFFFAYIFILAFAVKLGWFPSFASVQNDMGFFQRVYIVLLPAFALTVSMLAHVTRMTRAALIAEMSRPYIEMAFLNGNNPTRVVTRFALPNALGAISNVVALNLAYLVVSVIVVEVVFVYPGIGQLMVDSVSNRDVPVIQACGLVFAAVYVSLNLLADMVGILTNPRLRTPR
jgi:peptide/nickel transport system permease protein